MADKERNCMWGKEEGVSFNFSFNFASSDGADAGVIKEWNRNNNKKKQNNKIGSIKE